jgi:RES domain-containing protein
VFAWRIADMRRPIFDGTGAMLHGGRWNSVGVRVIYAAATYAAALLDVLVHANFSEPPRNHGVVRIEIPKTVGIEAVALDQVSGWDSEDVAETRAFGGDWVREARSAVLQVPNVITQGRESNLVINPAHREFGLIVAEAAVQVRWDERLFRVGR